MSSPCRCERVTMGDGTEIGTRVVHGEAWSREGRGEVVIATAPRLSDVLDSAVAAHRLVMVDLGSISFINSSWLATVLWAHQAAQQPVVRRPTQRSRRGFEGAGLPGVLIIQRTQGSESA